eukprot:59101-Alexandrium_andersonii.AAC.1
MHSQLAQAQHVSACARLGIVDGRIDIGQHEKHASVHSLIWRAAVDTDECIAGKHALSKDLREGDIQSLVP